MASDPTDVPEPSAEPVELRLLPDTAAIDASGSLTIGGVRLTDLAREHGTPLFVYDEATLRARAHEAVAAFGRDRVVYATKAFLCKEMARLAHDEGLLLDVSTGGEMHVALAAGVPGDRLTVHGNNKSMAELRTALEVGVRRIIVDSFDELDRLDALRREGLAVPKVLLRVTPGIKAETHAFISTGQDDSKFGFNVRNGDAMAALQRARASSSVELMGVHVHVGSQVFDVENFAQVARRVAAFSEPLGLPELTLGGGLGVPYVAAERGSTLTQWSEVLKSEVERAGITSDVIVEPGRALVAQAGVTIYEIGTVKRIEGVRTYVAVDGGMSDNPRPVLYGSGYEAFLPRNAASARPMRCRIVGKHCESGDVLLFEAQLPADARVGDVLCTPVTGAYGYSMASNYNKVPRPAVVFVADGSSRVVVRRETYDDLIRNDV
ncbi:MAG: diaminopimelate decarboxylase [Acidimicrobiia bacterium]